MILYRVFSWLATASERDPGGPLYNPRSLQRAGVYGGRHDIPEKDGLLYCSESPVSPVAEALKGFTNRTVGPSVFRREKTYDLALVGYRLSEKMNLIDLNDPHNLVSLNVPSSHLSTSHRDVTQALSEMIHEKNFDGFRWPSVLDGAWMNVSLFYDRIIDKVEIEKPPIRLNTKNDLVIQAARKLMINLRTRGR